MNKAQRLIVCLDGTWNQQDSSTNVLHHFNLVREGTDPGTGMVQKKKYHRGVGTSTLDRITGGGFGFGLEQNVRDAYNWLVENYGDGAPDVGPDQIFIFGFSRGAYTARSLVGFIGQCGLLRRGAPVTVNQLWQDYCILGRQKEERRSVWDTLLWKPEPRIRPITELVEDPWQGGQPRAKDLNPSEQLLVRWSRRVRITYLGIYDTVGAIGWDALAIPGLTSRMALHNNMRPTTLIQYCRHALALDENRSSFNHTPFLAYLGHDLDELNRGEDANPHESGNGERYWQRTRAMWDRKIEQRWFVGAHSNVGGGYEDNRLSEKPLQWVFEGGSQLGLVTEPITPDPPVTLAQQPPRDSYAEFAPPLWTYIIRAKRNYRAIDPRPVPKASAAGRTAPGTGFTLATIHETLDNSVIPYWTGAPIPVPPNLWEYTRRKQTPIPHAEAAHVWLNPTLRAHTAVVIWATLAAAGICTVDRYTGLIPSSGIVVIASVLAFLFSLVDWGESSLNFRCALGRGGPLAQATRDAIYWSRALGVLLFFIGVLDSLLVLPHLGWSRNFLPVRMLIENDWPVPIAAAIPPLLRSRSKFAWFSVITGPAGLALAGGALVSLGWLAAALLLKLPPEPWAPSWPNGHSVPGLLLLLQLALVYFWRALLWTREPLANSNLGSIVHLQRCFTPRAVTICLEYWRRQLACRWLEEDQNWAKGPAGVRMRAVLGECLWRDIVGLIPVYTLVFLFGLWFAASDLPGFAFLNWPGGPLALWWMIPFAAAFTNYLEDFCHLRFRQLHAEGRQPGLALTLFSGVMLCIKGPALGAAGALILSAVAVGTFQAWNDPPGWRAKISVLISLAAAAALILAVLARLIHGIRVPKTPRP